MKDTVDLLNIIFRKHGLTKDLKDEDLINGLLEHRNNSQHTFDVKLGICTIIDYQYRRCSAHTLAIFDLLYKSDSDSLAKLYLAYPFETEAFIRYGRENVNMLNIKLKEL